MIGKAAHFAYVERGLFSFVSPGNSEDFPGYQGEAVGHGLRDPLNTVRTVPARQSNAVHRLALGNACNRRL